MTQKISQAELIKRSFIEMMKDVGTSIPGHILAFDPETQLAQLQIGIQRKDKDGFNVPPPPIIECPVYFSGGSGFFIEHQIDPGDEGIILFSQRCIDAWNNSGGVAENPILRFHDFSDAYFLPGLRSQPNVISDFQNDGIRMSNKAGTNYIWLKKDGNAEIKVTKLTVTGDLECTKTITATTDVKTGTISLKDHLHTNAPAGTGTYVANTGTGDITGNSGKPTP